MSCLMTLFHPFLIVWTVILSRYEGCKSYLICSALLILIKLKTSYVLFKAVKNFGLMHVVQLHCCCCRRAYAPTSDTASHDNHEKMGFVFFLI